MRAALAAALLLAAAPAAGQVPATIAPPVTLPPSVPDGALLSREPYHFPYHDRAGWLTFVHELPGAAEAADRYAALVSEKQYADWAAGRTTRTSRISYAVGGARVRGVLVEPARPGRYPVIVFNHGGIGRWGRIVLWDLLELNRIAERGYVVFASAFRGEGGSEGRADYGGGDADDALALLKVADGLPNADASRAGMWGFSRGGLTTYAALARDRRVRAAAVVGGPVDLLDDPRRAEFDRFVYPDAVMGYRDDPAGALGRRSPLRWPERLAPNTALLILHGGDDPRVPASGAIAMAGALQRLRRSYRLKVYEGGTHDLLADWADARAEMDRWFDRYVRDRALPPANGTAVLPRSVTEAE